MPSRAWSMVVVAVLVASTASMGFVAACSPRVPPGEATPFAGSRVYRPTGPPTAAVVVLHGSEGGDAPFAPLLAHALAERGLVAVSFCWFGCEGLPDRVQRIPLDRTVEFLEWWRAGPAEGLHVVLYGASRGAEHALLLAALLGDTELIDGVAAHAGTDTVVAGYDPASQGPIAVAGGYDAAWTWRGEPIYGERALPFGSGPPIDVVRYPGSVFLSHGADDPLWPADRTRRLAERRARIPALDTEVYIWPGESHVLRNPDTVRALLTALIRFAGGLQVKRAPAEEGEVGTQSL